VQLGAGEPSPAARPSCPAGGTAAGELAWSVGSGGDGGTDDLGLVARTSPKGLLLPSCMSVRSACTGRGRAQGIWRGAREGEMHIPGGSSA